MSLRPVPTRKSAPPGALEAPKAPEARLRELLQIGAAKAARTGAYEDVQKWFSEPPPTDYDFPPLENMERLQFIVTRQEAGLPPYPEKVRGKPVDTFWTINANFPIFTDDYFCESFFKVFSWGEAMDKTHVQCLVPDFVVTGPTHHVEMPIKWVSEAINKYQQIPGFRDAKVTMVMKKDHWPVWEFPLSRPADADPNDANDECRWRTMSEVIHDLWWASYAPYRARFHR